MTEKVQVRVDKGSVLVRWAAHGQAVLTPAEAEALGQALLSAGADAGGATDVETVLALVRQAAHMSQFGLASVGAVLDEAEKLGVPPAVARGALLTLSKARKLELRPETSPDLLSARERARLPFVEPRPGWLYYLSWARPL